MMKQYFLLALIGLMAFSANAQDKRLSDKQVETLKALIATYTEKAKEDSFKEEGVIHDPTFSSEAGREFFLKRRTWQKHNFACSSCHTSNPTKEGKHVAFGTAIEPLAPAANPARFIEAAKVEKNLAMHCSDFYGRDCRALEKGNFIAYMMSIK